MMATAALDRGHVRDVMAWPSYELEELDRRPIPVPAGVVPGKHTTRKGWLTKDFQYPQSPYTCDIDARIWTARDGSRMSLREMARTGRLVLPPRHPPLLRPVHRAPPVRDPQRPRSQHARAARSPRRLRRRRPAVRVGDACCRASRRWRAARCPRRPPIAATTARTSAFVAERARDRASYLAGDVPAPLEVPEVGEIPAANTVVTIASPRRGQRQRPRARRGVAARGRATSGRRPRQRRRAETPRGSGAAPTRRLAVPAAAVRGTAESSAPSSAAATSAEGGRCRSPSPTGASPAPRTRRSSSSSSPAAACRIGAETYTPVGMIGWDQAVFRRDSDGKRRLLSIDQLLRRMNDWK